MEEIDYPRLLDRIKAVFVDSIVIMVLMMIAAYSFSLFGAVSNNLRIAFCVFIFVLYDPLFTSLFGGTIGHQLIGIRVKKTNNQAANIIFPMAVIRFLTKATLGWLSLLSVTGNEKRQALHDMISSSIVTYSD